MDLAENIEQISFGRSLPRLDSCLGLFLSPDMMYLAEVAVEGGRPKVLHLLRLPLGGADTGSATKTGGTLNTDFFKDNKEVFAALKKAMSQVSWTSKHVMVSLSHHFGILRYFTLPVIERRFWRTAIPVEAKKFIPIPFAQLENDFQARVLPPGADKKLRVGALFGVTHKTTLAGIRKIISDLGLELVGTEIAPCSVERLWNTLDTGAADSPYAQVHFDGGHVRILVSDNGLPIFYREVFLADNATPMDRRKIDLLGCIDFTRKQLNSPNMSKIRISGQIGQREEWQKAFSEDTGAAVEIQDTDKMLGLRGGQWGGYSAIGGALRHLVSTPLTLDLSAVGKISDEDRRTATGILAISAILAVFFLVVGIYRNTVVMAKSRQFRNLTSDAEVADAFRGKMAGDIELMIGEMRDKVNSFGALTAQQVSLTEVFQTIAETIPDPAWVTQVRYENPLSLTGNRQGRKLDITGFVSTGNRAEEQDIGYSFSTKLKSTKAFEEGFPFIEPSVEAPRETGDNEGGRTQPTSFKIKCASKKQK
ncbi:MAG: hypothetical protein COB53_08905 [Elusimicrobia bacterium]|nr:MAG: hypothetical protein COB53_08905 [Elusimicrobiota bacterium]